ncbi:Zn-ribbon domain-containing OB-fold protein [Pseudonocardia acaciae]|uniref:Zn-ribbon domain-containing OB-fold protein n=1 Tax=Pseudonocardia acaciae TaxID=551276 RepID=UPI0004915727|nr:OB-fold nucleic acid binding domain-containing protein [Pseudonocardia acaciae]
MVTREEPLIAPLEVGFDYTRSVGPVLGRFLTALRERRLEGVRGSDGRVHVPPVEYDPTDGKPLTDPVEVTAEGTVQSWSWMPTPLEGQPLDHPFAWALIKLDGADTALLHAVDTGTPSAIHTGLRVRPRWRDNPVGAVTDIACFEPVSGKRCYDNAYHSRVVTSDNDVSMVVTPVHLHYEHSASLEESRYLRGLAEGRLLGQRCPVCRKVYIPPRGACPVDGVPTEEDVELADTGTVTTFCIVNVPFLGQRITPPYVAAYVLLDGADIPLQHLVLGCAAEEVRMGMRVRAEWKPRAEWGTSLRNIDHFRPSGEPDAEFETYAEHL